MHPRPNATVNCRVRETTKSQTRLSTSDLVTLIQRKTPQHIHQLNVIVRLNIPSLLVKTAQVICDIPSIEFPRLESISQERKHVLVTVNDFVVLVSRALQHLQEVQSTPRPNSSLSICLPLLEPAATRAGPRRALQEEISMLTELNRGAHLRSQRFDVFKLALPDGIEDVARPLLD